MAVVFEFLYTGIPANACRVECEDVGENATVIDVLNTFEDVNGYEFDKSLLDGSTFVINKKVVAQDTVLNDGDHVMVIRTLGGG